MKTACLAVLAFASGCWGNGFDGGRGGDDRLRSFTVDDGCALTSTVALSGSSTTWTGCRLRYDDSTQVYTWQLTTPGTTGSWVGQAPGWFSLSFNLNSPENTRLVLAPVASTEPDFVDLDDVVFSYAPVTDANVGGEGFVDVDANIIYPGGQGSALAANLAIDVPGTGTFSGSLSATVGNARDGGVADLSVVTRDASEAVDASDVD